MLGSEPCLHHRRVSNALIYPVLLMLYKNEHLEQQFALESFLSFVVHSGFKLWFYPHLSKSLRGWESVSILWAPLLPPSTMWSKNTDKLPPFKPSLPALCEAKAQTSLHHSNPPFQHFVMQKHRQASSIQTCPRPASSIYSWFHPFYLVGFGPKTSYKLFMV